MTFDEANKLLNNPDSYYWGEEEYKAYNSFGVKVEHFICEGCTHLNDCKMIDIIDGDNFAIKSCNYFTTIGK